MLHSEKEIKPMHLPSGSNEKVQPQTTYLDSSVVLLQTNHCSYIQ